MAGAALVQKMWVTTPAETQKLACCPSVGGPSAGRRLSFTVVPSALEAVRDTELVEQRLRLEVGDPDRGCLAVLDGPVLGDLDHGVAAGEAEIHQRHHALVLRKEDVVAEPSEVEDVGEVGKDLVAKERRTRMETAPGQIVWRGRGEIGMQIPGELPEAACHAGLVVGIHHGLALLAARSVAHRTSPRKGKTQLSAKPSYPRSALSLHFAMYAGRPPVKDSISRGLPGMFAPTYQESARGKSVASASSSTCARHASSAATVASTRV